MGAGKWIGGERPKPPIDIELIVRDLEGAVVDWRIGGRSRAEIGDAMGRLSCECHRLANMLDPAPRDAALESIRQTVRRALAGTAQEPRERHRPVG